MKKAIVLLLVCFMALGASMAMADTRTDALGLTAGQQVDDLDSIWLFPQDAGNFGNVVDFRLGNPSNNWGDGGPYDVWGGIIHKDFDEIGYIGIYFNRPFNQSDNHSPNVSWANQNGILTGYLPWRLQSRPFIGGWFGNTLSDTYNHVTAGYHTGAQHIQIPGIGSVQDPQNKADLFWSKDFTDVTLGAHINYASLDSGDSGNHTGTFVPVAAPGAGTNISQSGNQGSNVLGLDLGLGVKNVGTFESLDFSLGYSMGSVDYNELNTRENPTSSGTNTWYNNSIKDDNISEIRANVLGKIKVSDTSTGRVYLNAKLGNLGFKQTFLTDTDNNGSTSNLGGDTSTRSNAYSDTNINFGLACDHVVADGKALVVAGIGLIYDGRGWKQNAAYNLAGSAVADQLVNGSGSTMNEDWWMVPVNVAIEAPIFDWLKARIGANTNLYNTVSAKVVEKTNINAGGTAFQDTTTVSMTDNYWSNINLTYGLSVHNGNFTLDLQVDPDALLDYAQNIAPGVGTLYGTDGSGTAPPSSPADLFNTFVQADLRYAF